MKIGRILPFIIVTLIIISCSNRGMISGKYGTNFPIYGMFSKTLTLNCDSTLILNFQGDLMNDNSFGKWTIMNDTLILHFDTINHPNSRHKKDLYLAIKRNKLINIPFSKKDYLRLVKKIKESGNDTLKIMSYRKFTRGGNRVMINSKGTLRKHYYRKIETFNCIK